MVEDCRGGEEEGAPSMVRLLCVPMAQCQCSRSSRRESKHFGAGQPDSVLASALACNRMACITFCTAHNCVLHLLKSPITVDRLREIAVAY